MWCAPKNTPFGELVAEGLLYQNTKFDVLVHILEMVLWPELWTTHVTSSILHFLSDKVIKYNVFID